MTEVTFNDKSNKPNEKSLNEKLGKNFKYWKEIKDYVNDNFGKATDEWKFYGKNYGWQLKTLLKKRNLFFLIPSSPGFKIVFIFGDKAVEAIKKSNISDELKETVIKAKKYAEGRGLPVEVKNKKYLPYIKKLIEIKITS